MDGSQDIQEPLAVAAAHGLGIRHQVGLDAGVDTWFEAVVRDDVHGHVKQLAQLVAEAPTCQAGVRHPGATGFHLVGRNRSHVRDQQQDSPRS